MSDSAVSPSDISGKSGILLCWVVPTGDERTEAVSESAVSPSNISGISVISGIPGI